MKNNTNILTKTPPEEYRQDYQQTLDNNEDKNDDAVAIGPGVRFRA